VTGNIGCLQFGPAVSMYVQSATVHAAVWGSIEITWKTEMGGVRDAKYKHVFEQETVTEKKI
jgi:hypothetical protein